MRVHVKPISFAARASLILGLIITNMIPSASAGEKADSDDQSVLDQCIANWRESPFKPGTKAHHVIRGSVKVFGIGGDKFDEDSDAVKPSKEPKLILVKPSINVMGKNTLHLSDPNGWYCFQSNVNVMGKLQIEANCKAHIAANEQGAVVMGSSDKDVGTAVMGSIKIKKVDCD